MMIRKHYLLSPGPTPLPKEVLTEAARPVIHHRTSEFSEIFRETSELLKYVFCTEQPVFIFASSGSGAMEAAVVNTLSPGEPVLVLNAGKFGERWAKINRAYGLDVREIIIEWGDDFTKDQLKKALEDNPGVKAVFVVLSETSTGTVYDVGAFGEVLSQTDALLIVDAVSGIVATPCPMDQWGIDALVSCSQKALMTPPGLAYISLSEKAWKRVETSKLPKFYFNLKAFKKSLDKATTPWTPAVSLIVQQRKALEIIKSFGLESLHEHHRILAEAVRAGAQAIGLALLSRKPGNICTAIRVPETVDGKKLLKTMQHKYGTYIAGGQDALAGKIIRIAHLGYMDAFDMLVALSSLEMTLMELGYSLEPGAALAAAEKIIKENWK